MLQTRVKYIIEFLEYNYEKYNYFQRLLQQGKNSICPQHFLARFDTIIM